MPANDMECIDPKTVYTKPAKEEISAEISVRIDLYLKRASHDSSIKNYSPDEIAFWRIMGGTDDEFGGRTPLKDIFYGKFRDVIAYAVRQPEFYGFWCSHDDPSNCNNGIIEKIDVRKLKECVSTA